MGTISVVVMLMATHNWGSLLYKNNPVLCSGFVLKLGWVQVIMELLTVGVTKRGVIVQKVIGISSRIC